MQWNNGIDGGSQCRWDAPRGFTLIEVMLALLIFGIVSATIFAAFAAISDGVEMGRQRTEQAHIGRAVIQRLSQELASSYRLRNSECREDAPPFFCKPLMGEDRADNHTAQDRIMLLSMPVQRYPETVPRGELCDVCYFIAPNDRGDTALFRSEDCALDAEKDDERCGSDIPALELTDAVIGLDFTYFGSDAEDGSEKWPPDDAENNGDGQLPCRIRVVLTLRDAPPSESVSTTVALPMQGACEAKDG